MLQALVPHVVQKEIILILNEEKIDSVYKIIWILFTLLWDSVLLAVIQTNGILMQHTNNALQKMHLKPLFSKCCPSCLRANQSNDEPNLCMCMYCHDMLS